MSIWNMMWSIGIFFASFGMFGLRQIWQSCFAFTVNVFSAKFNNQLFDYFLLSSFCFQTAKLKKFMGRCSVSLFFLLPTLPNSASNKMQSRICPTSGPPFNGRVTGDRCYDFTNIFAEKNLAKTGVFAQTTYC
jgi:hypothetical protein